MLVLTGRPMRRVSTYCYLAVLSAVDSLVLGVGLLPKWLDEVRVQVGAWAGGDGGCQNTPLS